MDRQGEVGGYHSRLSTSQWLMSQEKKSRRQAVCSSRHTVGKKAVRGKEKPEDTKGSSLNRNTANDARYKGIHSVDLRGTKREQIQRHTYRVTTKEFAKTALK